MRTTLASRVGLLGVAAAAALSLAAAPAQAAPAAPVPEAALTTGPATGQSTAQRIVAAAAVEGQVAAVPAGSQAVARARWFNLWFGQKKVKRPDNWTEWTTPRRKSKARHLQAVVTCTNRTAM